MSLASDPLSRIKMHAAIAFVAALGVACACGAAPARDVVTLSIVGTTDLHGYVFPRSDGQGGVALLGGYLKNLRAARAAAGGAVVLIDAGDTFQGGIESDLSEGAIVVDAYEALGYSAAVVGNHEFDFGPADRAGARQALGGDARGALKARAAQAKFPFLAANLFDESTDKLVEWPNVRPSVLIEAAGIKVGIVGVMSIGALRATLQANVQGLRLGPLADAVATEAKKLRAAGAQVVIVGAHAGGACTEFEDPADLSSCDQQSEIFELARTAPGLVDAIVAGHTHQGVAHEVGGVAIVQAYALGRAFGRVDIAFDTRTQRVVGREIFAPRDLCARQEPGAPSCETAASSTPPLPQARYEGLPVSPDSAIDAAMAPALARVRALQSTPVGVVLDMPFARSGDTESPLGNLFADALRERSGGDVALNNNVRGGLRTDLPAGPLTFGSLYDVFPFDNRLLTVTVTGAELRKVIADEIRRNRRGAIAVSGVLVSASCAADASLVVEVLRADDGRAVADDDRMTIVAMESLVSGVVFGSVAAAAGVRVAPDAPVMREVVEDWLRAHGGHLDAGSFIDPGRPRWSYAADLSSCVAR